MMGRLYAASLPCSISNLGFFLHDGLKLAYRKFKRAVTRYGVGESE
jgi:hypothetical protein